MARMRAATSLAFFLAALACDGGGGDAGRDPGGDEPGDEAVRLTASTPANGAVAVPVLTQIVLTFSGGLAPASVSADALPLRCFDPSGPDLVPTTAAYDAAASAITVTPVVPLGNARRCAIDADVRDATGRPVAASVAFRTAANPVLRIDRLNAAGVIVQVGEHVVDAMGSVVLVIWRAGAGVDGEWLTSDDLILEVTTREFDDQARRTRETYFTEPGEDGVWLSGDDVVEEWLELAYADAGGVATVHRFGPGFDGLALTADDDFLGWTGVTYGASGDAVREVAYGERGVDGAWFTADDGVNVAYEWVYDAANGHRARADRLVGPGADLIWFTADDDRQYTAYGRDPDAAGLVRMSWGVDSPGADLAWYTADDHVWYHETIEYDEQRRVARVTRYDDGPDGTGFTEDDVLVYWRVRTYADNGNALEEEEWRPGADGRPFTADDVLWAVTKFDPER